MAVTINTNAIAVHKADEAIPTPHLKAVGGKSIDEMIIVRTTIDVQYSAALGSSSTDGNVYNITDKGVIKAVFFQLAAFGPVAAMELIVDCTIDLRVNDFNIMQFQKYCNVPAVGGALFPRMNGVLWVPDINLPVGKDDYFKSILHADNSASTQVVDFAGQSFVYIAKED